MTVETQKATALQRLLDRGRKILADREAASEAEHEKHRQRMKEIFEGARKVALNLFAPLGGEVLVTPCEPEEGWNPYRHPDNNLRFELRPFGKEGGSIHVRLIGHYDSTNRGEDFWTWRLADERFTFYVGTQFRGWLDDDSNGYVRVDMCHETNDLAEAVAVCERHVEDYQRALAEAEERKRRASIQPLRRQTPAERFLESLETWIVSLAHGEE